MESINNKNYGENQQQQKVAGKRKAANDDEKPAAETGEKRQPEKDRKMDCHDCCWNDDPDMEEVCIRLRASINKRKVL
jgi:hypothetical protein